MTRICSIEGCSGTASKRGFCNRHYLRWYRHGDPLAGGPFFGETKAWLHEHADYDGDECLYWPFANAGYGSVRVDGSARHATSYMCELAHGPAPDAKPHALHSCGNGHLGCMNRNHLYWGDHFDNMRDKDKHLTSPVGSRHPAAKIHEDDVRAMRTLAASGVAIKDIASRYPISKSAASLIVSGKRWSHVK